MQIARQRDRLLRFTARLFGLSFTAVAVLCTVIPGAVGDDLLAAALIAIAAMVGSLLMLGHTGERRYVTAIVVAGSLAILLIGFGAPESLEPAAGTAVGFLAGGGVASVAVMLTRTRMQVLALLAAVTVTAASAAIAVGDWPSRLEVLGTTLVGWALAGLLGWWLVRSMPRASAAIGQQARAHRAEREASEMEALRRQSARLLHDTVLATLTLLAHSGVGVSPEALRAQAADDARLLRQLRLGGAPVPRGTPHGPAVPVAESALGNTLESVKTRFSRIGLEVSWHGTGQVLLPSDVLDAFLLALAECLENVRRHSGVTEAHVTIKEDATTVRALITDSGVGFHLGDVASGHLGVKESIQARLREIGGSARLFSAPGSGTTVVLEVPK